MLLETISLVRDLPRLHEISSVLIRYGAGDLVRRLGVGGILERAGRVLHWKQAVEIEHLEPPQRFRQGLEELGPTFIKLGQVLATRVDLFSPTWIAELEKLQTNVPALPFADMLPQMQLALQGRDPHLVFDHLNTTPRAAASIAQVYDACLKDGTAIIIKVRRPGIEVKIEADLRIMSHIARLVELEFPEARRYLPRQVVQQFAKSLRRELDLAAEARNIQRFGEKFADDETVFIPKVYWDYTGQTMNVQERIDGIPGNQLAQADAAGLDRKLLADNGANAVLRMILIHGYFHADPHPGNVFYLPGNRVALVDFGMTGMLTHERRNQIADLLIAMLQKDEMALLEVLLEWTGDSVVNESKLASDVIEFVFNYSSVHLKDISFGNLLNELTSMIREHHLILPSDLTLLFKTLITLEGLGRQLDPNFDMSTHTEPFVREVLRLRYSPDAVLKRGAHGVKDMVSVLTGLPRDLAKFFKELRRGRVRIDVDVKRLERFGQQLDRSTNRLTLGIMTASLVIGSSIVMTIQGGPKVFGMPILGFLGFLLAVFNSVWIVFSIWRSGKE
jgi:ubiquinone biosynthesis protein